MSKHAFGSLRWALPGLVLAFLGCADVTAPGSDGATWSKVALDERVTDAYSGFGFELFRQLRAEGADQNIVLSPTSAAFALVMAYNGADGLTAEEMANALGVGDLEIDLVNETSRTWLEALGRTGDPRAELEIANSLWYRDSYPVRSSYKDLVRAFYEAHVETMTTPARMNEWVSEHTRGRIDEIVADESFPNSVVGYLVNALYFKAEWTEKFDVAETSEADFRRADGTTVRVPMMTRTGAYEMRNDGAMRMLRMPYGAGRFSMIVALPQGDEDLGSIAELLDPDRWHAWMAELEEVPEVVVSLPRFEVEWSESLIPALEAMGMIEAFRPDADFTRMFEGGAWIDRVLQKTFLRVDEEGSEAAAVTKVRFVRSGQPSFTVDRPFFLAIYDHATETVLFLGQIVDPTA